MEKPRFSEQLTRPLLASMLMADNADDSIVCIRKSIYDGADILAMHTEYLRPEYHNHKTLKHIFDYAEDKPVFTMFYRTSFNQHVTEEERVALQLEAAKAGASMVDMMGDIYNPNPMQLATDQRTIDRQRSMVDAFHKEDCEVMFSSHTWCFMTAEQTLDHCDQLIRRGADMVKIAMCAFEEEQMQEVYRTTQLMKKELSVPFQHVCMGQYGKIHRMIAPLFGSMMVFCMQNYIPVANKEQPLLRAAKYVYDILDLRPACNEKIGAYVVLPEDE